MLGEMRSGERRVRPERWSKKASRRMTMREAKMIWMMSRRQAGRGSRQHGPRLRTLLRGRLSPESAAT